MEDKGNPTSIMTRLFGNETNIDVKNLDIERVDDEQTTKKNDDDLNERTQQEIHHRKIETGINFIDDTGVPHFDRDNRPDEEIYDSEAEESDDDFKLFGSKGTKRRKERRREETMKTEVIDFLSKMEVAAEQDLEAYALKLPAVHKLKMLPEVEVKLRQTELQELMLKNGLLKIICMWLNLMPDGNLPNINLRSSLIRLIDILPVETDDFDRKEELKRSGLAKILVFLTTIPQETGSNRAICKKLIEKWSRPVYELSAEYKYIHRSGQVYDAYDSDDDELSPRRSKGPSKILEPMDDVTVSVRSGPRYGEKGYRHHAEIPDSSIPEYTKRPRLKMDPGEVKSRGQSNEQRRIRKLVGKVSGLKKKSGQAYQPSVEGRGLVGIQK